jgi:RpiB/LacA/LacB family sugar-phosphate isomerase
MKIVNNPNMKTIKDKKLVVGADFAGYPLKEAVCKHLRERGWEIEDLGVKHENDNTPENMFHRVGLRVGAKISEGEYERALIFCGTGMGIHIAASKCPHVHAAVVESVAAGLRCITGNNCNVLSMGGFYIAHQMGIDIAEAYLSNDFGSGYEWWPNFLEFHKLAVDELEAFDYEKFKANGFKMDYITYEVPLPDVMNTHNPAYKA